MKKKLLFILILFYTVYINDCICQWTQQTSGTSTYLASIHFENDMTGWATGTSGATIRKTTNGGANWFSQSSGMLIGALNSVFFVDPFNGWIVGNQHYDSTIILKTTDGGNNWKFINQGGGKIFYCTYFVNLSTGWAVGESATTYSGIIYKTTNGGTNWFQQSVASVPEFNSCFFINENTGWAGGTNCFVKTSNGGLSWDTISTNLVTRGLYFVDALTGFMAENSSKIYKTTDGGLTWNVSYTGSGTISSVCFFGPMIGWACGVQGKVYKTIDGGSNWTIQPTPTTSNLNSIFFVSPMVGYVAGSDGVILKTINGGNSTSFSQTIHRYNINKPILSGQNTLDTISVITDKPFGFVTDVNVYLDTIFNTINSDLEISLIHLGVIDTIVYRVGGNSSNFFRTVLNDSALIPIESGTPPYIGQFKPSRPLAQFNNFPVDGQWILKIYDRAKSLTGVIKSWGITLTYSPNIGIKKISNEIPDRFLLYQNYPNPFNPKTNIKYQITKSSNVSIKIYDLLGREIVTLVNEKLQPGLYETQFDANQLPSGIYFYKFDAGELKDTKRMILIK